MIYIYEAMIINLLFLLGNLHLNAVGETHSNELLQLIEPYVFEWTGIIYIITL